MGEMVKINLQTKTTKHLKSLGFDLPKGRKTTVNVSHTWEQVLLSEYGISFGETTELVTICKQHSDTGHQLSDKVGELINTFKNKNHRRGRDNVYNVWLIVEKQHHAATHPLTNLETEHVETDQPSTLTVSPSSSPRSMSSSPVFMYYDSDTDIEIKPILQLEPRANTQVNEDDGSSAESSLPPMSNLSSPLELLDIMMDPYYDRSVKGIHKLESNTTFTTTTNNSQPRDGHLNDFNTITTTPVATGEDLYEHQEEIPHVPDRQNLQSRLNDPGDIALSVGPSSSNVSPPDNQIRSSVIHPNHAVVNGQRQHHSDESSCSVSINPEQDLDDVMRLRVETFKKMIADMPDGLLSHVYKELGELSVGTWQHWLNEAPRTTGILQLFRSIR